MAKVFFSYSHRDEELREQLEKQLSILKRQGIIEVWHDRKIGAGQDFGHEISDNLQKADIILLLVSPDFLDSDYCYDLEMTCAMKRQKRDEAIVIPVILRPCDWQETLFGKLLATPPGGDPVSLASNRDQAFLSVSRSVRDAANRVNAKQPSTVSQSAVSADAIAKNTVSNLSVPRSANMAIPQRFTDLDRDKFRTASFEFLAQFFENSLKELESHNTGVEGTHNRVDSNLFSAVAYVDGKQVTRCSIFLGGAAGFRDGIAYSSNGLGAGNSFNEMLNIGCDDQRLFLTSMGMSYNPRFNGKKLTQEEAAELYWAMFIEPLQRRS